jgi:hypothetical protein
MAESLHSPALSRTWLPVGVGLAAYGTALTRGNAFLGDPDVYQHVAVGRWIVSHGLVPHTDVFSYTMYGSPWVPHEWLSEVIFYGLYDRFGWIGIFVVVAAAFALAMALLARALAMFLAPTYALIGTMTAWGLCFPTLVARPHALVFPLMVAWIATLVAARNRDRAPSLFAALLMVLWANLHGSFMLGLAFAALFSGEALFEASDRRAVRRVILGWGGFGLLSLAAALATPNGIAGVLLPLDMVRMNFALSFVTEWQSPNFQHPQPLEMWLMLLLLGTLIAGIRLPVTRVVMFIVLLHMALLHVRYGAVLGMLTPLLIASFLASQLPRGPEEFMSAFIRRGFHGRATPATGVVALGCALVLLFGATAWYRDRIHGVDRFTPAAALAAVRQNQITGPVFNDFNFGGFLNLSGIPTFIDARVDMFGDRFLLRYAKRDELAGILSQYDITWTLLGADHPDVLLLDHTPGWRRLYADEVAIVHVRDVPAPH